MCGEDTYAAWNEWADGVCVCEHGAELHKFKLLPREEVLKQHKEKTETYTPTEPTQDEVRRMEQSMNRNITNPIQPTHDPVNHPKHYTGHPSGIECIQVTEHMNFCLGNAMKYIWRAGEKGSKVEDLKKARWYIDREIQRLEEAHD